MIDHILLGNSWKLTAFHFDPEYYKRAAIVGLREFGDQSSPGKRCQLRRSTQHLLEVYSQEFEIPGSFLDVDSSAARPGRAALE